MSRKKFRHLMMELVRLTHLKYGTKAGLGETLKFYRDRDIKETLKLSPYFYNSYSEVWNSEPFKNLRESVGMI